LHATPYVRSGTSFAAPFVSGVVALATSLKGRTLSNAEVIRALRETATPAADDRVDRILNAYEFLRRFGTVASDHLEPDSSPWPDEQTVTEGHLGSLHAALSDRTRDMDQFFIPDVPSCSTLRFKVEFVREPEWGSVNVYGWGDTATNREWVEPDTLQVEMARVDTWNYPSPSARVTVNVGLEGMRPTGYSVFDIERSANPISSEGPGELASCDGLDNDCDGTVDEGFPDSDGDGIANCIDVDDDNDCVPDAADNCALIRNANQFCSIAVPTGQRCGETCSYRASPEAFQGFDESLRVCFEKVWSEPNCWTDGCPWPGPLLDPAVERSIRSAALFAKDRVLMSRAEWAGVRKELALVERMEFLDDGRIRLPQELMSAPGAVTPLTTAPARLGAEPPQRETFNACRPLASIGDKIQQFSATVAYRQCIEELKAQPCQVDSDVDGKGDACDATPNVAD
jgi:hypothetical protein